MHMSIANMQCTSDHNTLLYFNSRLDSTMFYLFDVGLFCVALPHIFSIVFVLIVHGICLVH